MSFVSRLFSSLPSIELAILSVSYFSAQEAIASWVEKYETLKIANSMLGSDENKRETKLKINALIRDIDHCIGQISE